MWTYHTWRHVMLTGMSSRPDRSRTQNADLWRHRVLVRVSAWQNLTWVIQYIIYNNSYYLETTSIIVKQIWDNASSALWRHKTIDIGNMYREYLQLFVNLLTSLVQNSISCFNSRQNLKIILFLITPHHLCPPHLAKPICKSFYFYRVTEHLPYSIPVLKAMFVF